MDNKMFCFQCEQTVGCTSYTQKPVACQQTTEIWRNSGRADEHTHRAGQTTGNYPVSADTWRLMITGLFAAATNVNFNEKTIRS